jgi:hypothetical protein
MSAIVLPRWLVYSKAHRSGRRLFPKPKLPVPTFKADSRLPAHYSAQSLTEPDLPGEFANWEYRFWGPVTMRESDQVVAWQCRACLTMLLPKDMRNEHKEKCGCTTKLVAAYKIMLDKGFCFICNVYTKQKRWGVPLCSEKCEKDFTSKNNFVQTYRLREALEEVKKKHDVANGS